MTSKIFALSIVLFSLLLALTALQASSPSGSTQPPPVDVKGTWSGTFFSKYSNVAPFTMTVGITPNSVGIGRIREYHYDAPASVLPLPAQDHGAQTSYML